MKTLTQDEIIEVFMDTPIWPIQRCPDGPDDWGDPATVKLQLKHHGANFHSPWDHFGTYYGKHKIGYVVAIKGVASMEPVSGEVFDTIDEMKQRWQLD
jgi:hypothetical protein